MMNRKMISILGVALCLGACSRYNEDLAALDQTMMKSQNPAMAFAAPQDVAPAAGGSLDMLPQYLAREYYDLAKYENEKAYDYKAAKRYTEKALMASKGKMVDPSMVSSYDIPQSKKPALNEAYTALVSALKNQNTPENQMTLAKAQGRFDCWLERTEEAADDDHPASCRNEFEQAMASIVTPSAGIMTGTNAFDITFAQNSATPDEAAMSTISQIAGIMMDPAHAKDVASITGYTQASAQSEYATQLATSRAILVRDALARAGVPGNRLSAMIAGEQAGAAVVPVSATAGGEVVESSRKVRVVLQPAQEVFAPAPASLPQSN